MDWGEADYVMIVPDKKRETITFLFDDDADADADGRIDTIVLDTDRDDHPDYALYDTDGNGKIDMEGKFRNHEDEPYRYERVKEK